MSSIHTHRLQEAVFAKLVSDAALDARVTGIYDEPVPGARYPYVMMGDTTVTQNSVKGRAGARVSFDILVWSNEPSQMEAKELMALVDASLADAELDIVGNDIVDLRMLSSAVVRQYSSEGSLYRGRISYQVSVFAS